MPTAPAADPEIDTGSKHIPLQTSARMRLFQPDNIIESNIQFRSSSSLLLLFPVKELSETDNDVMPVIIPRDFFDRKGDSF